MFDEAALADGVITYAVDASMFPFDSYIDSYLGGLSAELGVDFVEVMPDYQYGGKKGTFVGTEAEFIFTGERASRVSTYEVSGIDPVTLAVNKDAGGPNVRSYIETGVLEALGADVASGEGVDTLTGIYGAGDGTQDGFSSFDANDIFGWVYKGRGASLDYILDSPADAPV